MLIIVFFYFAFQQQKHQKPSPEKRKGHFFKLRFGSRLKISAPTGMHQTLLSWKQIFPLTFEPLLEEMLRNESDVF